MIKKKMVKTLAVLSLIFLSTGISLSINTKAEGANTPKVQPEPGANITFSETKLNVSNKGDKMLIVTAINNATKENLLSVSELGYNIPGYQVVESDRAEITKYYDTITVGTNGKAKTAQDMGFKDSDINSKLLIWEITYNPNTTYDITAYAKTQTKEILGTQRNNQVKVTFKDGEEIIQEVTTNFNSKLTSIPAVPDKEGYEEGKWIIGKDEFTTSTIVKGNLIINAQYTAVSDIYKISDLTYDATGLVNKEIILPKATLNRINNNEVTDKLVTRTAKYVYATGGEKVIQGDAFTPDLSGTLNVTYSAYNGLIKKSIEIKVNPDIKENVLFDTSTKDVMLQKWTIGPQGSINANYITNDGNPYVKLTFGEDTAADWHQIYFKPYKERDFYKKYKYVKLETMVVGEKNQVVKQACFDMPASNNTINEWHTFYVPVNYYSGKCKGQNGTVELDSLKLMDKGHGTVTEVRVRNIEGVNELQNMENTISLLDINNIGVYNGSGKAVSNKIPVTMVEKTEKDPKYICIDYNGAEPALGDGWWTNVHLKQNEYIANGVYNYFTIKVRYSADRTVKKGEQSFGGIKAFNKVIENSKTNEWFTITVSRDELGGTKKGNNEYLMLIAKVMRFTNDQFSQGTIRSIDIAEITAHKSNPNVK